MGRIFPETKHSFRGSKRNQVRAVKDVFKDFYLAVMKPITLIATFLFFVRCTNSQRSYYKTRHFRLFYTKLDDKNIKEIADSLILQSFKKRLKTPPRTCHPGLSDLPQAFRKYT
jgi:hypothetical protein